MWASMMRMKLITTTVLVIKFFDTMIVFKIISVEQVKKSEHKQQFQKVFIRNILALLILNL